MMKSRLIAAALILIPTALGFAQETASTEITGQMINYEYQVTEGVLTGLNAEHELGWAPDDDLSVTALEQYSDLLPHVDRIAGAPAPEEVMQLTIPNVLALTIQNSATLDRARFSPRIQDLEIDVQRGSIFDTVLSASAQMSERETPSISGPPHSRSLTYSMSAGLSQRLATGGVLDASFGLSRGDTGTQHHITSTVFNNSVSVGFDQPLLRGFGPTVTRAPITRAQLESEATREDFRSTTIDTLAGAMNSYWDLFFAIQSAEVQLVNLEQSRVVLNNNRIRRQVGNMTRAEVLQAEATVAQREGDYFNALRGIQDAEDALWLQIDRTGESRRWNYGIEPSQVPIAASMELSEEQLLSIAYMMRPDLRAAVLRRDQAEISRRVAANSLLPRLNFVSELGFSGVGGEASTALDSTGTFDFENWVLGLTFEYPLQNRAARNSLRQAELRLAQSETGIEALRLSILFDVRNTLRSLQNTIDLYSARMAEVRARELELHDEQRRYEHQLSTTEILLRFQNDLATARLNRLSAVVSYMRGLIELDRATGRLLDQHGITIVDVEEATSQ